MNENIKKIIDERLEESKKFYERLGKPLTELGIRNRRESIEREILAQQKQEQTKKVEADTPEERAFYLRKIQGDIQLLNSQLNKLDIDSRAKSQIWTQIYTISQLHKSYTDNSEIMINKIQLDNMVQSTQILINRAISEAKQAEANKKREVQKSYAAYLVDVENKYNDYNNKISAMPENMSKAKILNELSTVKNLVDYFKKFNENELFIDKRRFESMFKQVDYLVNEAKKEEASNPVNEKETKDIVDEEIKKLEKRVSKEKLEKLKQEMEQSISKIHAHRDEKLKELEEQYKSAFDEHNKEMEKLTSSNLTLDEAVKSIKQAENKGGARIGYLRQVHERLNNLHKEFSNLVTDETIKSKIRAELDRIKERRDYYGSEAEVEINKQELENMLKNAYESIKDAKNVVSANETSPQPIMKLSNTVTPANSMTFSQIRAFEELTKQGWSGISGGNYKMYTAPVKNNGGQNISFEIKNNEITVAKTTQYDDKVREMFAKLAKAQFAGMSGEILVYHPDPAEAKKLADATVVEAQNPKLTFTPISNYDEYLVKTGKKQPEKKEEEVKKEEKTEGLNITEDDSRRCKP